MPYLYVVLCDCEGVDSRHHIAVISDDRDTGGEVIVGGFARSYTYEWSDAPTNRRGDHARPHRLICTGRCRRKIGSITDVTVGDILDKIALVRDQLDVVRIQDHFGPGGDELLELMGGRNLYVIPFAMLCTINSNIGNSR